MERVTIETVETTRGDETLGRRRLTGPLGTTNVAVNYYRLDPGDGLPGGLHAHFDQEEVFVVLEGEATFETTGGEVPVSAGEAIRFAPGEFQSGYNDGDGSLVVLALGAPRDTEDVRVPFPCPDCSHGELRFDTAGGKFNCPECSAEHVPAPCPDCGGEQLEATLAETGETVVVCQDCGATFERPPLRE